MVENIKIEIVEGDVLTIEADVLALKYAQKSYGADEIVSKRLVERGIDRSLMQPGPETFRLVSGVGAVEADDVLFVGVVPLRQFAYREIREFARRVLAAVAEIAPEARHVAATIHGAGFGLDEIEAFEAEVAGFVDALNDGDIPGSLERSALWKESHVA